MSRTREEEASGSKKRQRSFKERMFHDFKEFLAMFFYLWILFALFTLHGSIVLARHHISYKPYGLAFFNAFVLAKVMLVAENLNLGTRLRRRAPIYPILHKSFLFAIIFVGFNIAEHIVIGLWKGKTIAESLPKFGDGSPAEIVTVALILSVALIPFFAFREVGRAMGKGVLGVLLLRAAPTDCAAGPRGNERA